MKSSKRTGGSGGGIGVSTAFADSHLPHDDNQTRDAFLLGRNQDDVRCWGQIEISVDDKNDRVVVPSSLHKYLHGHAVAD